MHACMHTSLNNRIKLAACPMHKITTEPLSGRVQDGNEGDEDNDESWIAQQLARSMGPMAAPPAKPAARKVRLEI